LPRQFQCQIFVNCGAGPAIAVLRRACRRDYNKRVKEVVEKSWIAGGADDEEEAEQDGKKK
jgi:hypothetical protein